MTEINDREVFLLSCAAEGLMMRGYGPAVKRFTTRMSSVGKEEALIIEVTNDSVTIKKVVKPPDIDT